jgi:uncharacterized damage-inducible protein DinB
MIDSTDPRYPIGQFELQPFSGVLKEKWMNDLKFLPTDVEMALLNLDEAQLDTPYREGGWTVCELVHHIADSHMNAYIRFKLAMTEDNPTISPYEENEWAKLDDVYAEPINVSATLLHALHRRWVAAIKNLDDETWQLKTVFHPGKRKQMTLWELLSLYSWHGRHHVAHINRLRERNGW